MDTKQAIAVAKQYVQDIYADEQISNLGLEEIEHVVSAGTWIVTLAFSRPWSSPRTRAQEVLENLGALAPLKRSYKVVTIADDGVVLSMKNQSRTEQVE